MLAHMDSMQHCLMAQKGVVPGVLRRSARPFPSLHVFTSSSRAPKRQLRLRAGRLTVSATSTLDRPRVPSLGEVTKEDTLYDCVVVGGGISGLTTAQAFVSDHAGTVQRFAAWSAPKDDWNSYATSYSFPRFLLTEARERVGGNITSMQNEGYRWEEGPNSFQPNDSMLKAAVRLLRLNYLCRVP